MKERKKKLVAAVLMSFMLTSTNVGLVQNVSAVSASQSVESESDAMDYFHYSLEGGIENYLDKSLSQTNLERVLGYYKILYDYINNGSKVRNTYYNNLDYYNQEELSNMLNEMANRIYERYSNTSYFKSICNSELGFTLKYSSYQTGYDYDHEDTMKNYTETLKNNFEDYLYSNKSKSNLEKALTIYKQYCNFIVGNTKSYGYHFDELTLTEQEDIYRLLVNFTYDLEDTYGNYSYYNSTCVSKMNWVVNTTNLQREVLNKLDSDFQNGYINPGYSDQVPPTIDEWNSTYPSGIDQWNYPNYPNYNDYNSNYMAPNTSYHAHYVDPSYDTSRGIEDYTPNEIGEGNNWYNGYNSYDPYDNYYGNNDGYTPDYVPENIYSYTK